MVLLEQQSDEAYYSNIKARDRPIWIFFFRTDTNYLHVCVSDKRSAEPIFIYNKTFYLEHRRCGHFTPSHQTKLKTTLISTSLEVQGSKKIGRALIRTTSGKFSEQSEQQGFDAC